MESLMRDQSRQIVYKGSRRYIRSVHHIYMRPDGLAETPHGLARIKGENYIVKFSRRLTEIFQRNVWEVVPGSRAGRLRRK